MGKSTKSNAWYRFVTLPSGILFSVIVGINTGMQPYNTLKPFLATSLSYLGITLSATLFYSILGVMLLFGILLWAALYGKEILNAIFKWHEGSLHNQANKNYNTWYYWMARVIGFTNIYVNGLGVLYGAIGLLGLIQSAWAYPTLLALPLSLRIFQFVTGFLSGAIAAGTLTYNSLFNNIDKIKLRWERGLDRTTIAKVVVAMIAGLGLAVFNAEAGLQATNSLYLLFNIDFGLRPMVYTLVANANWLINGISTFFCASSFFLDSALSEDKNDRWDLVRFLAIGGVTWFATAEMIGALIVQQGSIWATILGSGIALHTFATLVTASSIYLLYRLFDVATKELCGIVASWLPRPTTTNELQFDENKLQGPSPIEASQRAWSKLWQGPTPSP